MDFKTKEELFGYLKEQEDRLAQLQETIDNQNTAVEEDAPKVDENVDDVADDETVSDDDIDELTDMLNL